MYLKAYIRMIKDTEMLSQAVFLPMVELLKLFSYMPMFLQLRKNSSDHGGEEQISCRYQLSLCRMPKVNASHCLHFT